MHTPRIDDRDWSALTLGDRIRQIEVEGYLLIPDLLTPQHVDRLKTDTAKLKTRPVDYSVHQQGCPDIQFIGGVISELAAHPPTLAFLRELLGDEILVMSYGYARSEPGHPGISLHTDGQPYGSAIFGYEGSIPTMVRVLYYLDDLTNEVSPFRVVPRSHLSLHADGNPYTRYESHPKRLSFLRKPVPPYSSITKSSTGISPISATERARCWRLPIDRRGRAPSRRYPPGMSRMWRNCPTICARCMETAIRGTGITTAATSRPTWRAKPRA